jgi:hypothetical protein
LNAQPSEKVVEVMNMMRFAITAAMVLGSIATASAQEPMGGQEVRDQSSKPAFSQAKAIRTAPSFASQAMMGFSVGTESGPEIRS